MSTELVFLRVTVLSLILLIVCLFGSMAHASSLPEGNPDNTLVCTGKIDYQPTRAVITDKDGNSCVVSYKILKNLNINCDHESECNLAGVFYKENTKNGVRTSYLNKVIDSQQLSPKELAPSCPQWMIDEGNHGICAH